MTQTPFHSPPPSSRSNDVRARRDDRMSFDDRMSLDEHPSLERDERERVELSGGQEPARTDLARTGERPLGTSYLGDGATDESWQRWRQIQGNFVDDPRRSVADAHGLVGEVIEGIVQRFETERLQLEERWSSGEDVSTDELRHCLQRYRDFFGRLLVNLGDVNP